LQRNDVETAFFVERTSDAAVAEVTRAGHHLVSRFDRSRFATVVADISHSRTLAHASATNQIFRDWRAGGARVVVIDGLGADSLYARSRPIAADLLVVPYAGANDAAWMLAPGGRVLAGPAYFIFGPSYRATAGQPRAIRPVATRILITFGGSDPKQGTLLALDALDAVKTHVLDVRVVIGPGFSPTLASAVKQAARRVTHQVRFLARPHDLAGEMSDCDLAIAAAGLTKYELALTGTPSIQLELDAERAASGAAFSALGAARNLGTVSEVTPSRLAATVEGLIGDAAARSAMSEAGRRVTDGRGIQRIIEAMELQADA
jgi:UDP-2,4-diacetamido-2,4,6-trideoxy-beta-L-altropyranose hydrolase